MFNIMVEEDSCSVRLWIVHADKIRRRLDKLSERDNNEPSNVIVLLTSNLVRSVLQSGAWTYSTVPFCVSAFKHTLSSNKCAVPTAEKMHFLRSKNSGKQIMFN